MPAAARQTRSPPAGPARSDGQTRSFLRVLSHELRTPLNSILGFSEILATELYGPLGNAQYREYAQIIRGSGEKLLKLVNQVVEIARLETGDTEIVLQSEALSRVFECLGEGVQEPLAERRLRLVVEPCGDLEVLADSRALRTVMSNLMQNAVTFSPEGGTITVRAGREGRRVDIVVENQGEGVDSADLARLVRPFEQGAAALTRHGEGAGLGLAICDLSCRAMGGQLKLVSERGQGFAAHVLLPMA